MGSDTNLNGASPLVYHLVDAHLEHLSIPEGSAAQHHAMIEVIRGAKDTASGGSAPKTPSVPRLQPATSGQELLLQMTNSSCSWKPHLSVQNFPHQMASAFRAPSPHPHPTRDPFAGLAPSQGSYWGLSAVRPSWVMAAFCPQLGWKSRRSGSAWAAGAARRRAPSGDSALRMALLRRSRSLWLLLWTMVTFTAIPYKSTTPYTTGGVSGVATPVMEQNEGGKWNRASLTEQDEV